MRKVTVAATQMACTDVVKENVERGEKLVREVFVTLGHRCDVEEAL